jgi:hypothetical protein
VDEDPVLLADDRRRHLLSLTPLGRSVLAEFARQADYTKYVIHQVTRGRNPRAILRNPNTGAWMEMDKLPADHEVQEDGKIVKRQGKPTTVVKQPTAPIGQSLPGQIKDQAQATLPGTPLMTNHPLEGMSREQMLATLAPLYNAGTDAWKLAQGIEQWQPTSAPYALLAKEVIRAVQEAQKKNSFDRPAIEKLYAQMQEKYPKLTLLDFQKSLVKMMVNGQIRLDPYTQAKVNAPTEKLRALIPLDMEVKGYVDLPAADKGAVTQPVQDAADKPVEVTVGDRGEKMRSYRPLDGKNLPHEAQLFKDTATAIRESARRHGGVSKIADVYDSLKVRYPALSLVDFHRQLLAWHRADKVHLQVVNDVRLEPPDVIAKGLVIEDDLRWGGGHPRVYIQLK